MYQQEKNIKGSKCKWFFRHEIPISHSIWILIGFIFWIGFYIGAVIMHAMNK